MASGGRIRGLISLVLPTVTAALSIVPTELRVLRESMETLDGGVHARRARNRRAGGKIAFEYALSNASLPLLTVIGVDVGYLLGGVIVAEVVFNFPGMGQLALVALNARDYPLVQGITIVTASVFVLVNLRSTCSTVVDPRIRLEQP